MAACRAHALSDVSSVKPSNAYVNGENVDDDVDGGDETRSLKIGNVDDECRDLKSVDDVDLEILVLDGNGAALANSVDDANDAVPANSVDGVNGATLANLISDVDLTSLQSDAFVPMRFHDDCGNGSYLLCDDD